MLSFPRRPQDVNAKLKRHQGIPQKRQAAKWGIWGAPPLWSWLKATPWMEIQASALISWGLQGKLRMSRLLPGLQGSQTMVD